METIDSTAVRNDIKAFASIILLLVLLSLSMGSCSLTGTGTGTATASDITSDNGYIVINTEKILVTCISSTDGRREMSKRSFGFEGTHFIAEEEYLDSRTDLVNGLKSGITIIFTLI